MQIETRLCMVWSEDGEDVSGLRGEIEFISSKNPLSGALGAYVFQDSKSF